MRDRTRRRLKIAVAERAGCARPTPEEPQPMEFTCCAYCGCQVVISWDIDEPAPTFEYCTLTGYDIAHMDHIVPEWLNGPTSPENTVIACAPCNLAKGPSPLGDPGFLRWLASRREEVAGSRLEWTLGRGA